MNSIGTKLMKKRMKDTMRLTLGELNHTLQQRRWKEKKNITGNVELTERNQPPIHNAILYLALHSIYLTRNPKAMMVMT